MRPTLKYLSAACAGALLFGCANVGSHAPAPPAPVKPAGSADDAYVIGRQQHLASHYALASTSYRAALQANPAHVNARNGLAALLAEQGEFGEAIRIWQELTRPAAGTHGPEFAYLYSNLGYAHFLSGAHDQALAALERACLLDPLNHRAWRHLGNVLEKLGSKERAQRMHAQASALEAHRFPADYALAQRTGTAAIDNAVAMERRPDGWAVNELRQGASGMFELHRTGAAGAPAVPAAVVPRAPAVAALAAPPAAAVPGPAPERARLEIRNGNGVTGMARALGRKMSDPGVRVVRLSNQKGFNVERTRVEYQGAYRDAASRLAERFGGATLVEVRNFHAADVRLVIGHDLVRGKADAQRAQRVSLAGRGGAAN